MKFLIIMGSPRLQGNTAELLKPFSARLKENGAVVECISLAEKKILPCTSCYFCQNVQGTYGCVQKDDVSDIMDRIISADCIVLATPIYTWYCTSQMKALLDRHYGLNKYYGTATGSLWAGRSLALITTHGYKADYANSPFEEGIKRLCEHSKLKYRGLYSVRDMEHIKAFQTPAAVSGAAAFADRLMKPISIEPVSRTELVLDGNQFSDREGFYKAMGELFISDKEFNIESSPGGLKNLLDEHYKLKGESILLRWNHFSKSSGDLGMSFINQIIDVIEEESKGHDCILNTKD